jgi:hypothetical protein
LQKQIEVFNQVNLNAAASRALLPGVSGMQSAQVIRQSFLTKKLRGLPQRFNDNELPVGYRHIRCRASKHSGTVVPGVARIVYSKNPQWNYANISVDQSLAECPRRRIVGIDSWSNPPVVFNGAS